MTPNRASTQFYQKVGLFLLGTVSAVLVLEILLRAGGALYLLRQEQSNQSSFSKNQGTTILCIGESTTALGGENSYPTQLQELLDANAPDKKYKVINKGIPAVSTKDIVHKIEGFLSTYEPDIVVSMIGVNDKFYAAEIKMTWLQRLRRLAGQWRVVKLAVLLGEHVQARLEEIGWAEVRQTSLPDRATPAEHGVEFDYDEVVQVGTEEEIQKILGEITRLHETSGKLKELAKALERQGKQKALEEVSQKIRIVETRMSYLMLGVGFWHKERGAYDKAKSFYASACLLGPRNVPAFVEMAKILRREKDYVQTQQILLRVLDNFPDDQSANIELARTFRESGDTRKTAQQYKKILEKYSLKDIVYWEMAEWFEDHGYFSEAEQSYKIVMQKLPYNRSVPLRLAQMYEARSQFDEAESVYLGMLDRMDNEPSGHDFALKLAQLYKKEGKDDLAEEYFRKSRERKLQYYFPETTENYRLIASKVAAKGARLVAMQYPARDIRPLAEILKDFEGVVFVENKNNFEEALRQNDFTDVFTDGFGGDFGHATRYGNRLIAENLAKTILALEH